MAYLLGAAAVMESLQKDVRDVQETVTDIISRVGPMQFTSWKFPDKQSCDLDIEDLLDLYSYSDDEEERQVAHIALYELVIDRLVLLLQSMGKYTDRMLKTARSDSAAGPGTSTSVGLVVKRYWTQLTQLNSAVKQTATEKGALNRKVSDLEGDVSRLNAEIIQHKSQPKTVGFGGLIPPNRAELTLGKSLDPRALQQLGLGYGRDEYNKSCQTTETAFTPCDSCSGVQKCLRQTGDIVLGICQQQQIPSCLQKFRPQVSHLDWLTGSDVLRWSAEQNKDLQRISKLTATIKPLRDDLSECNARCDKLQKRVSNFDRDLKEERDTKIALSRQYELKLKELESQHRKTVELEQQQKELLQQNKEELERLLEQHKSELKEQQQVLKDLESTKLKLEGELSNNKTNIEEVKRLEGEMGSLQSRLDNISQKMEKSAKELQKEQAINKSTSKHSQSLQSKQEALLQRIDMLDKENVDLRDQVSELEEEKETLEETRDSMKRETTQIQRQLKEKQAELDQVEADKESLEQSISTLENSLQNLTDKLEEAQERERLIVDYPDINGPVNPDITGTGDIVLDMENQVKANTVRIELLETQNEGLRRSVMKLRQMQQPSEEEPTPPTQYATHVKTTEPKPLWDPNYLNRIKEEQSKNINTNSANQQHQVTNPPVKNASSAGIKTFQFEDVPVTPQQAGFGSRSASGNNRPATGSTSKIKHEVLVGRPERPNTGLSQKREKSASSIKSRPASGKAMAWAPVNTTSIGAYIQLKRSGKLNLNNSSPSKTGSHPASGKPGVTVPSGETEEYQMQENFMCDRCDKMYTRQRDLEIHKSYCTA